MNIFVVGGGRVGFHLVRLLSAENHDITVIESDPAAVEQIDYALDVKTVQGNAASVMLLNELGAGRADLFVATTGRDEINLIAAALAKGLGAKQAVARVDGAVFIESSVLYESVLGIDYILSPEALTALEVANFIESPGVVATENFGRGNIQMRQVRVTRSPMARGKSLKDIVLPPQILLAVITREGATLIPHGDTCVERGDLVTLIGKRDQMRAAVKLFQDAEPKPRKAVIMGGGSIGMYLAQVLEGQQRAVKVFDRRPNRCEELAARLARTDVVCRDATSRDALEQEHVGDADVFVSTTADDERNIMACVLAKEVGARRSVAVVHHPDFAPLVAKLGVDHAVTPRACIANQVLRMVHQERVVSLAVLEEGQVEIVEFEVSGEAPILARQLKDIKFPPGALVAAILRGEQVIVPGGGDEILAGDSVILLAKADSLDAVQKLFQR